MNTNIENTENKNSTDYQTHIGVFLGEYRVSMNFVEWRTPDEILSHHQFSVPIQGDAVDEQNLVSSVFETAEKEIGWEMITDGVVFTPNVKQGFGIDRVDFVVSPVRKKYADEINLPEIQWKDSMKRDFLHLFMQNRGIEDLVYIEANTTEIFIWRLQSKQDDRFVLDKTGEKLEAQNAEQNSKKVQISNISLQWGDIENKAKEKNWENLRKFLTSSKPESELKEVWSNLMFSPKLKYESVLAQDILRADLTANLLSLKTSAFKELSDFGARPGTKSTVLVTGDLAVSMEKSHMLLALIDGLELYGTVQFIIDDKDIIPAFTKLNVDTTGVYSKLIEKLIGDKYTLFSAEPDGSGANDEIIVEGIVENEDGRREFFGLRNRISMIKLDKNANLYLQSKKAKNVGGVSGHAIHQNISGSLIIDSREPQFVTYGPDYKSNNKVHAWVNSL